MRFVLRQFNQICNNWNLARPKLSYTNFCVKNLELYQSLFVEDSFIALKAYTVLSRTVITNLICDSILGFTIQKVHILNPFRTTKTPFYTSFIKFFMFVITWMYNKNYTTIEKVFLFFTYISILFIWVLFYLNVRFIVLFY